MKGVGRAVKNIILNAQGEIRTTPWGLEGFCIDCDDWMLITGFSPRKRTSIRYRIENRCKLHANAYRKAQRRDRELNTLERELLEDQLRIQRDLHARLRSITLSFHFELEDAE